MRTISYSKRPDFLKSEFVAGICVCECVRDGLHDDFPELAHAHCDAHDPFCGWICVKNPEHVSFKPLMLHEVAHILVNDGHTDKWRKTLLMIGGTLDSVYVPGTGLYMPSFHKKVRG